MNDNKHFSYLVYAAAFVLAGCAAYYSIYGLGKLFSSQAVAVMIMAAVLEASKLISASYLHRYWDKISISIRAYLTVAVAILMLITSIGIYGFLISAYQDTKNKLNISQTEIELRQVKQQNVTNNIQQIESQIAFKLDRIQTLNSVRSQQEARLDSLYLRNQSKNAKRVEEYIQGVDSEIKTIQTELQQDKNRIASFQDSIANIQIDINTLQNSDVAAEIGPLQYVATITGMTLDIVVNWFVLIFIFVFDPLAVTLLIAAQKISKTQDVQLNNEKEIIEPQPVQETIVETTPIIKTEVTGSDIFKEFYGETNTNLNTNPKVIS